MQDINEMLNFARGQGLLIDTIITDGKLRRAKTIDKPNNLEAWWVAFSNCLMVGNWRTGMKCIWHPKGYTPTHQDNESLRLARIAFKAESDKQKLKAINVCNDIWSKTALAHEHPYLSKKNIEPYVARLDRFNNLVVPIISSDGDLMSLQFISPTGEKRFKSGGSLKGHAAMIGSLESASSLLVCEGYATGCSLHEATSLPVVIAFNAGNLEAVCTSLKRNHPMLKIILCADNDHRAEQRGQTNVGLDKANAIAKLLNLQMIWPKFSDEDLGSDFNDVHCQLGIDGLHMMLSPVFDGGTK